MKIHPFKPYLSLIIIAMPLLSFAKPVTCANLDGNWSEEESI